MKRQWNPSLAFLKSTEMGGRDGSRERELEWGWRKDQAGRLLEGWVKISQDKEKKPRNRKFWESHLQKWLLIEEIQSKHITLWLTWGVEGILSFHDDTLDIQPCQLRASCQKFYTLSADLVKLRLFRNFIGGPARGSGPDYKRYPLLRCKNH